MSERAPDACPPVPAARQGCEALNQDGCVQKGRSRWGVKGPREKENFSLCIVPNLPAALGPLAPPFWGSCRSSGAGPFCKLLRAPQRQAVAALLADLTRLREGMAGLQPAELLNSVLDAAGLYERARWAGMGCGMLPLAGASRNACCAAAGQR